jgi:hypothetical protein
LNLIINITLTYRNIQSYLYKLYVRPEKKKPASA